ncbi:hypothetical protein L486_05922 [Kwoniella mangroviensis CBS 10435]|uniref:WKF domain-containing protein n=1 Tax=Kwoniella mangroviensis CBS 10435 TaxID=1331196 RepID=A0A1B9IND6_9TREE|nr:hypothetical protein L486_05922 [Kwoniella mangroviensis CBS 10435]
MGKSKYDEAISTSTSQSSKHLEKLEKKLKKAEEKMKKAEEKMRIAKEEYEKAQAQTLAQRQAQEKSSTKNEKKEKKDKKRKRDTDEVEQEQEPQAEQQSVEVEQVDETSKIVEQQQDGDGERIEKKSKREKKDNKDKKKKTKLEKALEAEATAENNSSDHAKIGEEEGGAKGIFEDGSLSDQAKKNIYYAHLYSISRQPGVEGELEGVNWKFSKAKQNWLIRNIFSADEIPDKYVELVLNYLKTIQGLSKTNVIESANKIINPPAAPPADANPDEVGVEGEGQVKENEETTQEQEKEQKDTEQAEQVVLPLPDTEKAQSEQIKENLQKERAKRLLSIMQ